MAERLRPGFVVPLGFYDGPEVKSIPRRIRAAAIGVWTLCGNYSATKLLDGYVDAETLKQFGCTPAIRAALAATVNAEGELSPLWEDAKNSGTQFTNWAKWQRTNAEVTAYRGSEAQRKKDERKGKRNSATSRDSETSARTSFGQNLDVRTDERDPKTKTETKTESVLPGVTSSVCLPTGSAPDPAHTTRPSEFCPRHPTGTGDNCGPCANARRAAKAWDTANAERLGVADNAQAVARAERLAAIDACTICDPNGLTYTDPDDYDSPLIRCTHTEVPAHA